MLPRSTYFLLTYFLHIFTVILSIYFVSIFLFLICSLNFCLFLVSLVFNITPTSFSFPLLSPSPSPAAAAVARTECYFRSLNQTGRKEGIWENARGAEAIVCSRLKGALRACCNKYNHILTTHTLAKKRAWKMRSNFLSNLGFLVFAPVYSNVRTYVHLLLKALFSNF